MKDWKHGTRKWKGWPMKRTCILVGDYGIQIFISYLFSCMYQFFSPFLQFNPFIFLFIHLLSFFLHPTQLDSCFLEATLASVHLLLSSPCYLSSPLENERRRFKNHEHSRVWEFSQTGKLCHCQQQMTLYVAPSKDCSVFSGFNPEVPPSLPPIFQCIVWT